MNNWKEVLSRTWLSIFTPSSQSGGVVQEKEKPLLEQVELLVDVLNVEYFLDYNPSLGQGIFIETFYLFFSDYVEDIETHIASMQHNRPVIESRCRRKANLIPINKFFLSPEGFYDNVHDNVLAFRSAVKRLCMQLRSGKEETTATNSAIGDYNLRLLTPLLDNIRVVLLTLMELEHIQR